MFERWLWVQWVIRGSTAVWQRQSDGSDVGRVGSRRLLLGELRLCTPLGRIYLE